MIIEPSNFRKRRSESLLESVASKKSKPTCYLLRLPFEIRVVILKHLLANGGQPIYFRFASAALGPLYRCISSERQNRILWPEILCTCRQLQQEGTSILYDNTGLATVTPTDSPQAYYSARVVSKVLKENEIYPSKESTWMTKLYRISIVVTSRPDPDLSAPDIEDDGFAWLRRAVRLVADFLERHPNFTHIDIEFKEDFSRVADNVDMYTSARAMQSLGQFSNLRNRVSLTCKGSANDADMKRRLADMLTNKVVYDLASMHDKLEQYFDCLNPRDKSEEWMHGEISRAVRCAGWAADNLDEKAFIIERRYFTQRVSAFLLWQQRTLFDYDPERKPKPKDLRHALKMIEGPVHPTYQHINDTGFPFFGLAAALVDGRPGENVADWEPQKVIEDERPLTPVSDYED